MYICLQQVLKAVVNQHPEASACAGERMALNIFEPRYRLLVRRCMAGSRRFGMACIDYNNVLHEDACEAEIVECQPQPDGWVLPLWPHRHLSVLAHP